MAIKGHLKPGERPSGQRGADRLHLSLEVTGSVRAEDHVPVVIHNLSVSGLLLEMAAPLRVGEEIVVELPEAGNVAATAVWTSGKLVGCRFAEQLSKATLSAALLRNPVEPDFASVSDHEHAGIGESLAEKLTRLRQARGFSRRDLAARAGISRPTLWAWESGRTPPRRKNLQRLAHALEVREEELLGRQRSKAGNFDPNRAPGPKTHAPHIAESTSKDNPEALTDLIAHCKAKISELTAIPPERITITIEF